MTYHLPALITLLTVCLQIGVMVNVGRARGKYKIPPPATTGQPDFERAYRIQVNTVESTLMFLPSLWIFAAYLSELWAGVLGAVWLLGRVVYVIGYQRATEKRTPGFLISSLAILALVLGGAAGLVRVLVLTQAHPSL